MNKIIKYILIDMLRNRLVIGYALFLFMVSMAIFSLEDNVAKGLLSMLNIILFIVPLVTMLFSTIYVYNSAEFIELIVSQPLRRKTIWLSIFWGLAIALMGAFLLGAALPVLIFQWNLTGLMMVAMGLLLSLIFVALALFVSAMARDKARGIGIVILLWLYFSILFDAIVLFFLFQFADYPLEKAMVAITALNPIDLSRILILLKMDISALMGYTGAIFRNYFGTATGMILSILVLSFWAFIPVSISLRIFNRKDL